MLLQCLARHTRVSTWNRGEVRFHFILCFSPCGVYIYSVPFSPRSLLRGEAIKAEKKTKWRTRQRGREQIVLALICARKHSATAVRDFVVATSDRMLSRETVYRLKYVNCVRVRRINVFRFRKTSDRSSRRILQSARKSNFHQRRCIASGELT